MVHRSLLLFTLMVVALWTGACRCDGGGIVPQQLAFELEPRHVTFPNTSLGTSREQELTLTNSGTADLSGTVKVEGAGFFVEPAAVALGVGGNTTLKVRFAPEAPGIHSGTITVTVESLSQSVALSGEAEACVSPGVCQESAWSEEKKTCVVTAQTGNFCRTDCVLGGYCRSGKCEGVAVYCDDANACTTDRCEEGTGCINDFSMEHCPEPEEACRVRVCDAATGCGIALAGDGAECVQGCQAGTCTAGVCIADRPRSCDDGNPCTQDLCDEEAGCYHEDATFSCPTPGPCQAPTCSAESGCGFEPVADGTPCGPATCEGIPICQTSACVVSPPPTGWCNDEREPKRFGAGRLHTCRVLPESGSVECWGENEGGQLGDGTTTDRHIPTPVVGLPPVVEIAVGVHHNCARTAAGEVYCWGFNDRHQVSPRAAVRETTPVRVLGLPPVTSLSLNSGVSCAVTLAGQIYCWGERQEPFGISLRRTPTRFTVFPQAQKVIASNDRICALLWDSSVWCWGLGRDESLADGVPGPERPWSFAAVRAVANDGPLVGVVELAHTGPNMCARMLDGSVRCVMVRDDNVLPGAKHQFPDAGPWFSPVLFGQPVKRILDQPGGVGCLILDDNTVRCWVFRGGNQHGRLGNGTDNFATEVSDASGVTSVTELSGGLFHNCASFADGEFRCWGRNDVGQLGDGTTIERHAP